MISEEVKTEVTNEIKNTNNFEGRWYNSRYKLYDIFQIISKYKDDIKLCFNNDGLKILEMSKSRELLLDIFITNSDFYIYLGTAEISVKVSDLLKQMKKFNNKKDIFDIVVQDRIVFKYDNTEFIIKNTIDDYNNRAVDGEIKHDISFEVKLEDIVKFIDVSDSNLIKFIFDGKTLTLESEDDYTKFVKKIKVSNINADYSGDEVVSQYQKKNLQFLKILSKITKKCSIGYSNDNPIEIITKLPSVESYVRVAIAPFVTESCDEDEPIDYYEDEENNEGDTTTEDIDNEKNNENDEVEYTGEMVTCELCNKTVSILEADSTDEHNFLCRECFEKEMFTNNE